MITLLKALETVEAVRDICYNGVILPKGFTGRILSIVNGEVPTLTLGTTGLTYKGLDPRDFKPTGKRGLVKFLSTKTIALTR